MHNNTWTTHACVNENIKTSDFYMFFKCWIVDVLFVLIIIHKKKYLGKNKKIYHIKYMGSMGLSR